MRKGKKSPDSMTFLEHLDDLRKRLFYSFLAIIFTIFPAWFFHKQIFARKKRNMSFLLFS